MAIAAFKELLMKLIFTSISLCIAAYSMAASASDTAKINYQVTFPQEILVQSYRSSIASEPNYHQEQPDYSSDGDMERSP